MTLFSDAHVTDDPVTLVLLGLIVLLVGIPVILLLVQKASRPPLGARSFRWLCLGWASLLAASSVWSLSREALLSAEDAGTNNFVRLGFLLIGASVVVFVGARYGFALFQELASGALGIFTVFALWGLATTLWSVSPVGTFYKSVEYGTMLALFALVASTIKILFRNPHDRLVVLKGIFDWHWFLLLLMVASVYVAMIVFPEYAILRAWRDQVGVLGFSIQGVLPGLSANAVGTLGAIVGIVALVRVLLRPGYRLFWVPVFLIGMVTMVLTQSRSPILAFMVAAVAVLFANRRLGVMAALGAILGSVLLTRYGGLVYEYMRRGQSNENLTQLTGRVEWWQAGFEAIREKPLSGYGANFGGRYILESTLGETVSDLHSSFVQVLLDTGVIGLALFVAGLVATWFMMLRVRPYAANDPIASLLWLESLGVLSVLSVRSFFAIVLIWSWYVLNFGVILVFLSVVRRRGDSALHTGAAIAQPLPAARGRRPSIRR